MMFVIIRYILNIIYTTYITCTLYTLLKQQYHLLKALKGDQSVHRLFSLLHYTHRRHFVLFVNKTYKHEEVRGGLDTTHKGHNKTHYTPHKRPGDHSPKELSPFLDLSHFERGQAGSALRIAGGFVSSVLR